MPTSLTPRTKPTTNLTTRTKPVVFSLWLAITKPWQLSYPWQYNGTSGGTEITPRIKP